MVTPSNFVIKLNHNFDINRPVLYKLYMPIVGINAIFLYEYLYNEYQLKNSTNIYISDHNDLCLLLKWDLNDLTNAFKRLEAVGLLKKYLKNDLSQQTTYLLLEALSFEEFISHPPLLQLLENNISKTERYSLNYTFSKSMVDADLIEQTTPIDYLFKEQDLKLEHEPDLDFIYHFFINKYQTPVVIELALKQRLINFLLNHQIEPNNLLKILENSLTKSIDCFELKDHLFEIKLHEYIMEVNKKSSVQTIKINRNFEIFSFNANLEHFQTVINEYNNWSAEEYFKLAAKQTLSIEITKSFKNLREKLCLPDSFINVLTDFCLFRNNGRFSLKYIEKIANSVSKAGLSKIEQMIAYLSYVASNKTHYFSKDILNKPIVVENNTLSNKQKLDIDFSFLNTSSSKNT